MRRGPSLIALALFVVCPFESVAPIVAQEKPHVIIETDLGGDPDDEASMVRFLLYACDFHIDGIILTNPKTRSGSNGSALFEQFLAAYGEVLPNLKLHRSDYPSVAELRAVTTTAYRNDGVKNPAGADLLIRVAEKKASYRTWYQNWGTSSSMHLAWQRIDEKQGVVGLTKFCHQFHISSLKHGCPPHSLKGHFDRTQMREAHRESGMIVVNHSGAGDSSYGNWYHQMGLTTSAAGTSVKEDITTNHGPLGTLYTTQKEGDTAAFLYLVPTGLNEVTRPDQGNWAGRYGRVKPGQNFVSDTLYYWPNQEDAWNGETSWQNTRKRWGDDAQSDFLCRLDWCVMDYAQANHPPRVVVDDDETLTVIRMQVAGGSRVALSAVGSSDPDSGDLLRYNWFHYQEAGTYDDLVTIANAHEQSCQIQIPQNAQAGDTIHVILAVSDNGSRRGSGIRDLARYRRTVLTVAD